jgi:hypothetical protein
MIQVPLLFLVSAVAFRVPVKLCLLCRLEAVEAAEVIEADLEPTLTRLCWDVELGLAASETE